jgi:acetate kinase
LVFAGSIRQNAPGIWEGLDFLRIATDPQRNAKNAMLISPNVDRVKVRVIRTAEELMIARSCGPEIILG